MKFRDLTIGQEFDWIKPGAFNSFFLRCVKISARKYRDSKGAVHTVGTTNAAIYNEDKL